MIDLLGTRNRDFAETAALMTQLDLVITPDTAVAHLAGRPRTEGLGRSLLRGRLALPARPQRDTVVSDHAAFPSVEARRLGRCVRSR